MKEVDFSHYLCGKVHDPDIKTEDWNSDLTKVTCKKCIEIIMDRKRYYALVNKIHLNKKS